MAYVVPIHRASSIRHAVKLNFFSPDEECLVAAKASRLEFYTLTPDGIVLTVTRALNARVTMLARLPAPTNSPTDHIFVGTDQYNYFTITWDRETNDIKTARTCVDIAEPSSRESQCAPRCLIDPTGRFMTLEVYEGVIVVVPIVQPTKKRGRMSMAGSQPDFPLQVGELDKPTTSRIDELFVRSSAFLHSESSPWLALLYEDNQQKVRLRIRELDFTPGSSGTLADATFKEVQKLEGGEFGQELDLGSSHLIPIPAPLGGLIVLGETSIKYIDDNANDVITRHLEEATVFVAWEKVDSQRWLLADDYGRLFFLSFILNNLGEIDDWKLESLGKTARASVLVYLGGGMLFVGSHHGDSQVLRLDGTSFEVIQTLSNIAPILDFTIMDLGNRTNESQTHEFSSGQARIVTGSGAFDDGTLRSLRSGVGMEDLGVLGEMEHISDLWGLQTRSTGDYLDTLIVTFVDETRVFQFSPDGEVEELDNFLGLSLTESTLLATRLQGGRILQVTEQRALVADLESGMVIFEWVPQDQKLITAVSTNEDHLVLVISGQIVASFDIRDNVQIIKLKDLGADQQISGLTVPSTPTGVFIAGFPQSAKVSILDIKDFAVLQTKSLGPPGESFPRSVLVAEVLANSQPTLFISMADGCVITFSLDSRDCSLSEMNKLILGSEQPIFKKLPKGDGLYNVFATCENPSLIYGSEGRIIYSAVNSDGASRVCHLNAEAYPDSIAVATEKELKIALVDRERTTQIQTLPMGSTVRRVAYSPSEKAFGIGTIDRKLENGAEVVKSHFVLADEIMFRRLDALELGPDELVESVVRAELPAGKDENGKEIVKDRFVVGTAFADEDQEESIRGRILILEVDHGRKLSQVAELPVMGACRALAMMGDCIVAALVVVYRVKINNVGPMKLEKLAAYRTSTAPVDVTVVDNLIAVADLMKSLCLIRYTPGHTGEPAKLTEVGRHYQTVWSTAIACVGDETFLQSDAEGNLIVLSRNTNGVTAQDKHRLIPTSEISLGEMVNRIRPVHIPQLCSVMVTPRAFMATVEGSIFLFAVINPEHQDFLMTLQAALSQKLNSLGNLSFDKFRGFRTMVRSAAAPYRFVDGELIEQFLKCTPSMQEEIAQEVGSSDVGEVKRLIEALRRLH
ncbi:UV-damaged DNA binding protein, putative [Penicillium digitatum PHI26]|uniref:DNA damage-binding protein 1 n=2 Tax=Penicillium digitatum TaxID=36651 RepID=K9GY98_PEND2|nr:UV-damaged DNA binding protein, putative [Penicillium digitatum Pd1]EKV15851.1 UV-damaged DNA binding protein, putative [Penicillium digitatum Pd1]EKV17916.1 UV-damaged DNA binding protein, putative [Penicillium digitatum PHI26]